MKVEALIIEAAEVEHLFNIIGWDKTNDTKIILGRDNGLHIAIFITKYWGQEIPTDDYIPAGELFPSRANA
jgi:hypothetical protein